MKLFLYLSFIFFCAHTCLAQSAGLTNDLKSKEKLDLSIIDTGNNLVEFSIAPIQEAISHDFNDHERLHIYIVWKNSNPVRLGVQLNKNHRLDAIALSGEFYNNSDSDWLGLHVSLGSGAIWAQSSRYYSSAGRPVATFKSEVNSVFAWNPHQIQQGSHNEIPFIDRMKYVSDGFAAIGFMPTFPIGGKLIIGATIKRERMEGLDWIIDLTKIDPSNMLTIRIQPSTKKSFPLESQQRKISY